MSRRLYLIGRTLSHYHITMAIGACGMGEVYRATDTKLGRDVALKLLPAEMARDPKRLARFQREARAVAALSHPYIVTIFSVEEAHGGGATGAGLNFRVRRQAPGRPFQTLVVYEPWRL